MNSFTTVIYTFKVSKHIIIGQSTNINVFSWLLSFFKLREREWYAKFGYKGKWPQSYLSYFSTGFHWRIFLLSQATRLCYVFNTGLKNSGPSCLSILLSSTRSRMAMIHLPATDPAQKLTFLLSISADGEGESPLPFWGPSQSFGFSLFPLPVSGDLRLLSTNTCWYPSVTHILPQRSLFWRFDTVNSNGRIVLIFLLPVGYHVTSCNKVRGKYICKEVFLCLPWCVIYHCVSINPVYIFMQHILIWCMCQQSSSRIQNEPGYRKRQS